MSLILSYHTPEYGIVCSDSRVSRRLPDGRYQAIPGQSAKKFIVPRPGLVLAGSSSLSGRLDFDVFDAVRRYVEVFPLASFDKVADFIPTAVADAFGERDANLSLHLLGGDPKQGRVRSKSFHFSGSDCQTAEYDSGLIISGFVEKHETQELGRKMFAMMDGDRSLQSAHSALLALAEEIERTRTEPVIGPPYHFHVVTPEQTV